MRIDGFFRFILYLWNTSIVFEEFEVSIVDLAVANDFLLANRTKTRGSQEPVSFTWL
jgi:hypothetical protein